MVTFAFGIAIGVVIGLFSVNLGQLSIGLGSAGGLLTSGLVIGYLRSVYPTFGWLPAVLFCSFKFVIPAKAGI